MRGDCDTCGGCGDCLDAIASTYHIVPLAPATGEYFSVVVVVLVCLHTIKPKL